MAKNANTSCDNCGNVLFGRDRGAFQKKNNLFVNGQMGKNEFDTNTGWHETIFLTRTKNEQLAFCDNEYACLIEWMEKQMMLFRNRREAKLRERASGEHMERLELGGFNRSDKRPYDPRN